MPAYYPEGIEQTSAVSLALEKLAQVPINFDPLRYHPFFHALERVDFSKKTADRLIGSMYFSDAEGVRTRLYNYVNNPKTRLPKKIQLWLDFCNDFEELLNNLTQNYDPSSIKNRLLIEISNTKTALTSYINKLKNYGIDEEKESSYTTYQFSEKVQQQLRKESSKLINIQEHFFIYTKETIEKMICARFPARSLVRDHMISMSSFCDQDKFNYKKIEYNINRILTFLYYKISAIPKQYFTIPCVDSFITKHKKSLASQIFNKQSDSKQTRLLLNQLDVTSITHEATTISHAQQYLQSQPHVLMQSNTQSLIEDKSDQQQLRKKAYNDHTNQLYDNLQTLVSNYGKNHAVVQSIRLKIFLYMRDRKVFYIEKINKLIGHTFAFIEDFNVELQAFESYRQDVHLHYHEKFTHFHSKVNKSLSEVFDEQAAVLLIKEQQQLIDEQLNQNRRRINIFESPSKNNPTNDTVGTPEHTCSQKIEPPIDRVSSTISKPTQQQKRLNTFIELLESKSTKITTKDINKVALAIGGKLSRTKNGYRFSMPLKNPGLGSTISLLQTCFHPHHDGNLKPATVRDMLDMFKEAGYRKDITQPNSGEILSP